MPLYPEITPTRTGHLKLTDGHTMYYEQSGNLHGVPMLFLHGGPGSGISSKHHRYANPAKVHTITFDQRGCGTSKPLHSLKANTTQHLVADIERLRQHLKIDRWLVTGFSWGCTLALAYAQTHPERVKGLVVGGVFLGTKRECDWLTHPDGVARFFPQDYAMLMEALESPKPADVNAALVGMLKHSKPAKAQAAAKAWCRLEAAALDIVLDRAALEEELEQDKATLPALALMEAHYFAHACFLKPGQLLANIGAIAHIPLHIVQGALDMVCPPESALALHAAHPDSRLYWVDLCGHRANAKGATTRVKAVADMVKKTSR